jgi:transcriptional regulator with XRE-family HTH domain
MITKEDIKAFRINHGIKKRDGKKKPLTQRQLGILSGYSRHQIYRLEAGKRQITPHFEAALENIETLLRNGDIKIPE